MEQVRQSYFIKFILFFYLKRSWTIIIKLIKENEMLNVEFEGIDSSLGMILLAKERFNKSNFNVNLNV
jgi:hypothetical protein